MPDDFVAYLQSNPHLEVGQPIPITIGEVTGVQIDALVRDIGQRQSFIGLKETSWNYLDYTERWRFIILDDIGGERLLIGYVGSVEGFSAATELVQQVLGSVVFTR